MTVHAECILYAYTNKNRLCLCHSVIKPHILGNIYGLLDKSKFSSKFHGTFTENTLTIQKHLSKLAFSYSKNSNSLTCLTSSADWIIPEILA